jgi:hypothetical protein
MDNFCRFPDSSGGCTQVTLAAVEALDRLTDMPGGFGHKAQTLKQLRI